jgi:8-oxo-dGTP pyrophosphatase MutT (NUDIX family)
MRLFILKICLKNEHIFNINIYCIVYIKSFKNYEIREIMVKHKQNNHQQNPYNGLNYHSNGARRNHINKICINCGMSGHIAIKCNEPPTSFGVICVKKQPDNTFKFLMVRRKDSLSYIEFLKGTYSLSRIDYIRKMFEYMSAYEKFKIATYSFEQLWFDLWGDMGTTRFQIKKLYNEAYIKFSKFVIGYFLKLHSSDDKIYVSLQTILNETPDLHQEQEWEFPKGRRHLNEPDVDCAIRELYEETNVQLDRSNILIKKPFEEIYIGTNGNRYKNVYYLARVPDHIDHHLDLENKKQIAEISKIDWYTLPGIMNILRANYVERKELAKRVNKALFAIQSI